jgi:type VI secretion system secreted protein Hcp
MAFQAHIAIKGKKTGQYKGEGIQDKRKDKWIPVLCFNNEIVAPRDAATGQASGKRQWKPVKVVKEWGAASPQALQSCSTNEVLTEVDLEFTKTNPNGEEYVYQTIKLTDATIAQVRRFTGSEEGAEGTSRHSSAEDTMELEEWSFTFRKIEVEDKDGKTSFMDDWAATT